jgi:hypothetical protein
MAQLTESDILANAGEIRAIARRPIGRICARTDCVICGQSMTAGASAQMVAKQVWAHAACVRALRVRLDEAAPKREAPPRPRELLFEGESLEVK